jgi:hypothetical protein
MEVRDGGCVMAGVQDEGACVMGSCMTGMHDGCA